MLFNKVSYGKDGSYKYYVGYLSDCFRPLHIIIKEIKLYANYGNILANKKNFLKHIELFSKIKYLFNKKSNKRGFNSNLINNIEYIKGNKMLIKDEYYGNLIINRIYL